MKPAFFSIQQFLNTKAYQAYLAKFDLYSSIGLYDWLCRVPEGQHKMAENMWVSIEHKEDGIQVYITTDRKDNDRSIAKAVALKYDEKGLISCNSQELTMHLNYYRSDLYESTNKKNEKLTRECKKYALRCFIAGGDRFFNNKPQNYSFN